MHCVTIKLHQDATIPLSKVAKIAMLTYALYSFKASQVSTKKH